MVLPVDDTPRKPRCSLCRATYVHGQPFAHAAGCPQGGRGVTVATLPEPKPADAPKVKRPASGAMAEIAMRAILNDLGYVAIEDATETTPAGIVYVAEFTFAPHERRWRCDFCLVVKRLAIEVDGGAHASRKEHFGKDTEKRGELAARGYRVVTVTPEEVKDGTARDRVSRALDIAAALAARNMEG